MTEKKELFFNVDSVIIDHLGIQMYQGAVPSVAELVANAWDADAENVGITLPSPDVNLNDAEIVVQDDGVGMTFEECQKQFLHLGYRRRGRKNFDLSPEKERLVLGRKGIGKIAGFGIAKRIQVETVSKKSGELTTFLLDVDELRAADEDEGRGTPVQVLAYDERYGVQRHGTTITLKDLTLSRRPSSDLFAKSMARRFLLRQESNDFQILVNNESLPEDDTDINLSFPRDYSAEERERIGNLIHVDGEWGREMVGDHEVEWRIRFFNNTIKEPDLRGISVFAGVKVMQAPFFFDLSGGVSGQHGLQYISGQIRADFIDKQKDDHIAPERQRVDWDHPDTRPLRKWGLERMKALLVILANRQEAKKQRMLHNSDVFAPRLERLEATERRKLLKVLKPLEKMDSMSVDQFESVGNSIILIWEQGLLKELMAEIANSGSLEAAKLVNLLVEADILTSIQIAESVKTRIYAIAQLQERIKSRDIENEIRDHIGAHPWIISPQWATFKVESSIKRLLSKLANDADFTPEKCPDLDGRADLTLVSGDHILLLEFMRPGLTLDRDHIQRFETYVDTVSDHMAANTGWKYRQCTGYIVADNIHKRISPRKIESLVDRRMFALDWDTLLIRATSQWQESLELLVARNPDDQRLKDLLGE